MLETQYNSYASSTRDFSNASLNGQATLAHEAFALGMAGANRDRAWRASLLLGRDASAGLSREDAEAFFAWNYAEGAFCARLYDL